MWMYSIGGWEPRPMVLDHRWLLFLDQKSTISHQVHPGINPSYSRILDASSLNINNLHLFLNENVLPDSEFW